MCLKSRLILLPVILLSLAGCFSSPRDAKEQQIPKRAECDIAASDQTFDEADLNCVQFEDVCGTPGWPPCEP